MFSVGHGLDQPNIVQMNSDEEVVDKWKRQKNQARNLIKMASTKVIPNTSKRASCDTKTAKSKKQETKDG